MANEELTDYEKSVQEEMELLAQKREAVRQKLIGMNLDDPETMKIAKETALDLIPDAAITIRYLILHAESENIKMNLSKWIFELAMKEKTKLDNDDELSNFLRELTEDPKEKNA